MPNDTEVQKKPVYKKWWFWLIIIIILIAISSSKTQNNTISNTGNNQNTSGIGEQKTQVTIIDFSASTRESIEEWCTNNKIKCNFVEEYSDTVEKGMFISQSVQANDIMDEGDTLTIKYSLGREPSIEYKNALKKGETYAKMMHMSKQAIYDQLTSEYGENFPADAAQYAIDNLNVDWKANALEKAKTYQETMSMSRQRIYDQLISEYGEKFTEEEAQYAIDNLPQ